MIDGLLITLAVIIVIAFIGYVSFVTGPQVAPNRTSTKKHIIFDSDWYKNAGKEFEGDCYFPPSHSRSILIEDGYIQREAQYYKPVRRSTYSPAFDKLEPWFKSYCIMDCGTERFMQLEFTE